MDKTGYEFVQVTTGEPRKSLFSRAVLACATPFALGVIVFAALGVWALNSSPDEILRSNFWTDFIRAVRVFAPFLDDLAKNGLKIEVAAFYACAACFWLCFFAAVFCLNYGKEDFRRVNLIKLTASFVLLGGFCFLALSGLLFAPDGIGGRLGVYVRFDAYALANESAPYNLAVALVIGAIFAAFGGVVCDLIYRLRSGRRE